MKTKSKKCVSELSSYWGRMFYQNRKSKEILDTQMRIYMDEPEIENFLSARFLKVFFF